MCDRLELEQSASCAVAVNVLAAPPAVPLDEMAVKLDALMGQLFEYVTRASSTDSLEGAGSSEQPPPPRAVRLFATVLDAFESAVLNTRRLGV